jgi:hypothetical protein
VVGDDRRPDPGQLQFSGIEFDPAWNLDGVDYLSDLTVQTAQLDPAGSWYLAMNPDSGSRQRTNFAEDPRPIGSVAAADRTPSSGAQDTTN